MSEPGTSPKHPAFFNSAEELRRWYERHHAEARELWLGIHKKSSGLDSVTNKEALDEALCFGWIDSVRMPYNDTSYAQRYSPRRARSVWSDVNIRRMEELIAEGRVTPAGLAAFERRDPERSGIYSFERHKAALGEDFEAVFRGNAGAWEYWERQPPSYRKIAAWWVISAKREETRRKRLATLMEDSANGRRIALVNRAPKA